MVACLFLAPINWFAFVSGDAPFPVKIIVLLLDLGPPILVGGLVYEQFAEVFLLPVDWRGEPGPTD